MIFLLFLKIYEWNIRYGHKQQLSHEILLYIPLVDFLWPREIQYLQYYYLYELKEKSEVIFMCNLRKLPNTTQVFEMFTYCWQTQGAVS